MTEQKKKNGITITARDGGAGAKPPEEPTKKSTQKPVTPPAPTKEGESNAD